VSSTLWRSWACDVEDCDACAAHPADPRRTPSSYQPPEGWWAGRPNLAPDRAVTGARYLCPAHAARGRDYDARAAAWRAARSDAWAQNLPTQEAVARMLEWKAAHPYPMLDLSRSTS
jgi:hypothetical protein